MKSIFILLILLLMGKSILFSQGLFTLSTNKTNYSYGEVIEVEVSIFNNTDTTIIFHPECEWPVWVRVKGVKFLEMHSLADGCERYLAKGEQETWKYQIDPSKLGFPINDGEQIIYGSGYSHVDSVAITAPKYYGGIIEVKYDYVLEKERRDIYFTSLNASLVKRDTIKDIQQMDELWSIQNKSIDSLVYEQNRSQDRFGYVDTYRRFEQGKKIITSLDKEEPMPSCYLLMNNFPNPFNPGTTITYQLPKQSKVKIRICDMLGREVATIVNEEKSAGVYSVLFEGNNLSSGIYFYQLQTDEIILTKKFVLIK
ncbi:MAG: T9SS type A sorting domain-containing protein [Ignavibacteriales bacterium]|nr:T9SS type A sorting domain-containing protein [Ignavibacteriales bacterium]